MAVEKEVMTDVLAHGRAACHKARDAFYACLERESDKKPTEVGTVGLQFPAECKKHRAEFTKNCRPTWVKHFDREHCKKKRVQWLLDGGEPRRGKIYLIAEINIYEERPRPSGKFQRKLDTPW